MSEQILKKIQNIQIELNELAVKKDFLQAKRVILSIVKLLDESISINDENAFQLFTDDNGKIKSNAHWFYEDSVVIDRKATYKVYPSNNLNIDFKLYGITKPSKGRIAWVQALTPNFEDEPYYQNDNVGIDFVVPKSADKIIIILSNNWVIRTLELKGELTVTYQEIFAKWAEIKHFDNKRELHNILWDSFDISPLNKKFYIGISERFNILRQYLVKENIFDEKHSAFFANRLLGRIIFCWFLDKKGIINSELEYFDSKSFPDDNEYYKKKLEKLFFEVLNTPIEERNVKDEMTPFLNGGLFEARENDLYRDSKLTFPKNYFDNLYDFLLSYNFTTDESTSQFQQVAIDPEMLGRIFENLLAEITEETGEQARKAKGAFYTPREIVDYMCKESLKEYLKTKIKEDEYRDERISQLVEGPIRNFEDQARNWRNKWKPYKEEVIKALDELKILDPACGSGAFPIGMLQLLVLVYERLDARFDSYKTKLRIIEKNIYGVDIEPMAVEIARLRTWLSIIVDEESDSKKIKPLPNLEFKFVCANSLIDLDKDTTVLGDDPNLDSKLQKIRDAYFNTESLNKKRKLRLEYEKLASKQTNLFGESLRSKQLKTYRPFDNESSADFFNPEFMFGIKNFDTVIGNPPYVTYKGRQKVNVSGQELKYYLENYKNSAEYKVNSYALFIERAFNLIKENGTLSYIIPSTILQNKYLEKIRSYILKNQQIDFIVIFENKVFQAVTDSIILQCSKRKSGKAVKIFKKDNLKLSNNLQFINWKQDDWLVNEGKIINLRISKEQGLLISKIDKNSHFLEEFLNINIGIKRAKAPIVNIKKGNNYKNFIVGRELFKFFVKSEGNFILFDKSLFHTGIDESIFLQREKILVRKTGNILIASYDNSQFYTDQSIYNIYLKKNVQDISIKYICALLNTKLMNWYFNKKMITNANVFPYIKGIHLKKFPIKKISLIEQNFFVHIVNKILNITFSPDYDCKNPSQSQKELEKEIDQLTYKVYNLTNDEIKIIEENI